MDDLKQKLPFAAARGIKLWESGGDFPPRPADDDVLSDIGHTWLGFMMARAYDHIERCRIANALGCDPETVAIYPPSITEG
jgi:hypothetical protein